MAKANSSFSEVQIARRIKEGRGQGHGKDYIPWLTVQEVPSSGRSHRIYSHKTGRVHHLLSDLELAVFLSLEWESSVLDIREQFPLLPSDTRQIAIDSGIKHPVIRGVDQVMSTDFLVDCKDGPFEQFAIQVKPAAALQDERTLEKLELERRYGLKRHGIETMLALMSQIANAHALGLLVIDEIQHLSRSRSGGSQEMLNFFVTMVNIIGVPVMLIGTPKAREIFEADLRSARRGAGFGAIFWDPIQQTQRG